MILTNSSSEKGFNIPTETALSKCAVVELPKIYEIRGSLTFVEGTRHLPFEIRRVYYLYDVPGGAVRAGHAHLALQQCLIAVAGSFDVTLDDAFERRRFTLNRPSQALVIPPMLWRDIDNFSSGSVCLALASDFYDEADYVRDYGRFLRLAESCA